MRAAGIVFLLIFVPESLSYERASTQFLASSPKHYSKGVSRKSIIQRVKDANPVHIFSSTSLTQASVRRNMIALASVNTIMFGAFMGAMNVMLLYSEVGPILSYVALPLS